MVESEEKSPHDGPFIAAAFCCEQVELIDGTPTFHSVGDQTTIMTPGGTAEFPLVVAVRPGKVLGLVRLRVDLQDPYATFTRGFIQEEKQLAPPPGLTSFVCRIRFDPAYEGLYVFTCYLNDELATKIPLEVVYGFPIHGKVGPEQQIG